MSKSTPDSGRGSNDDLDVRYVSDGDVHRSKKRKKRDVSIHVGGLKLDKTKKKADDKNNDDSIEIQSGEMVVRTVKTDEGRSPKPSWDMILMLLFSGSGWRLFFVLLGIVFIFGFPISLIVMGSLYYGSISACYEDRIPVLLIVGGILSLLSILTRAGRGTTKKRQKRKVIQRQRQEMLVADDNGITQSAMILDTTTIAEGEVESYYSLSGNDEDPAAGCGYIFLLFIHCVIVLADTAWLIAASVIVYQMWVTVDMEDDEAEMYCDKGLYLYTFSYITICWILSAISILYYTVTCIKKCNNNN